VPKVSVIMPAYNCGRYMDDSIRSVMNQSCRDLELIVVNDGSDDDTGEVMSGYRNNKRIKYLKNSEKKGPSVGRNMGIDASVGDFLTFLDADDIFLKEKLSKQVKFLEKKKSCDICYTNSIYFKDGAGKEIISDRYHFSGDVFYYLKRSNFIPVCTVMARRGVFKENKFNESVKLIGHEDWEFFVRLAFKGLNFRYMDEPLVKIRIRRGSTTVSDIMHGSRREAGLMAKAYWREFKRSIQVSSVRGREAMLRYLKFKIIGFFLGFPQSGRFNKPVARQLLGE